MAPTRWGILSAGKISHDFVSCLRSLPEGEHKVVAVGARDPQTAKDFAKLHHIPSVTTYEGVAQNPDVEVVYVGSLNPQHLPLATQMLEAGKHVLVEKPLTLSKEDTQSLVTLAREKNLFLMEAMWSRFLPPYARLMEEIQKGTIGEVRYAHVSFGIPITDVARVSQKVLGGGTVYDIGIYAINAMCMVFGGRDPSGIAAVGHLNTEGVDTGVAVSLRYGDNQLATLTTSATCQLGNELVVTGTKGSLTIPSPFWCSTNLVLPDGQRLDFPLPPTVTPCVYVNSSGLRFEAMEVRRCILAGLVESPKMSHKDSLQLAGIMGEVMRQVGV